MRLRRFPEIGGKITFTLRLFGIGDREMKNRASCATRLARSRSPIIKPSARMRSEGYGSRTVCVCVCVCVCVSRPLICDSRN